MRFMNRGNQGGNGDGQEFRDAMQEAVEKVQAQQPTAQFAKFFGTAIGFVFATFFVPFVIVYAYNGLQPAVWPDISYLPTVAGLFVFRVLINMVRTE